MRSAHWLPKRCGRASPNGNTAGIDQPTHLTVAELAAELGCTEEDVRALIRKDELRTVACGIRPGLVPRRELDAYRRRLSHRALSGRSAQPAPGER